MAQSVARQVRFLSPIMCGIAGELSWGAPADAEVVRRMTAAVAHRGPDAEGCFHHGPIALGHRRLAIIDLSDAGRQPMCDVDGRCWIVFNGEIYNFQQLRRDLEADGARFRSRSDTEVILETYKRWDVACLHRLNGMFAFGLWDAARQRLLLARDRAGEKPLFYQPLPDGVAFASELQALERHPGVPGRISPAALGQFLSLNYIVDPDCLIAGVRKLEAGHYLLVERDRPLQPVRYWFLADAFRSKLRHASGAAAAEELDALLTDAVRVRLVSDAPLGAFLSGGLDSATVVAAMARLRPPEQNQTFSIGFAEVTYDEVPQARAAARAIGVDHHDRIVDADMAAALSTIVDAADEPMADTSAIPMYYLARFAREWVTVCLSGDGGDENFAGYETYRADALHRSFRWLPAGLARALAGTVDALVPVTFDKVSFEFKLRRFLRGQRWSSERAHYAWREIGDDRGRAAVLRPDVRADVLAADPFASYERHYSEVRDLAPLDQSLYVDIKTWLASDILTKVDRMTMAHALESRAPFLDYRVMEFAARLPPDLKLRGLRTKHVLKASQRRYLPGSIIERAKQGFNAPVSRWLAGPLHELGRDTTAAAAMRTWFDPAAIDRLWTEHRARRCDHGLQLFGLTWLALWLTQRS